jgi:serine O-acetyltransferase
VKGLGVSFNALTLHSLGRAAMRHRIPLLPRLIEALCFLIFNSSIPLAAEIGAGSCCGHRGIGVVISRQARIGERCLIRPGVVIGGRSGGTVGAPQIGDDVEIGAGAKILGPITIGDGAMIGANAVVNKDVPAGALAVGIPARVIEGRGRAPGKRWQLT